MSTTTTHPSALWDSAPLDLPAYLGRIGHDGPLTPTLDTLRALIRAHLDAIPFEGLDSVLGRPVPIDIESVQDKLVRRGRGGYCHEHNTLFASVLDRLGFQVTARSARMLVGGDEHEMGPVGHTILSVVLEGVDWHVDVGIGNFGPRGPIPLVDGAEVSTGPWEYRMDRSARDHWVLRLRRPEGWFNLIQFTEEPCYRADIAVHNYVASTDPGSPFTQQIVVHHDGEDVRRTLNGLTLTTYRPGGERTRREIAADEVPETLRTVFGLALPEEHGRALVEFARSSAASPWAASLTA
ncbi:arylamine N-acetyltransferase [Nocardiopsis sp. CT-R113]|uniref:Arylamine N-acetyltransferase n=1 Tax=Nocardiopsis codii TaxID=3065942 RepID=A0ABU7K7P4_9ACTN|nr:arylamine N-acetyltransferase [Nocardiopsis sp. CT-R113]MEE2038254.1 arylamine N-acetyltransferase [Nocardiopsis sp. CT-R113]